MRKNIYHKQAELLLRILPYVMKKECFVLKGGTAINFFVRNMPRYSIDIDLLYIPIEDREKSLKTISDCLVDISNELKKIFSSIKVNLQKVSGSNLIEKLVVQKEDAIVKIEPNLVFRGAFLPLENRELCKDAQEIFEMTLDIQCLSFAELYGGKICAVLDRQHPRDLFDIKLLLDNEGISELIGKAFVVFLIGHNRPIHELLNPRLKSIRNIFDNEFSGMTRIGCKVEELEEARERLILYIRKSLTIDEKEFLLSFKEIKPKWELIGLEDIERLPAVQWKLINLKRMSKEKHIKALKQLEKILS